MATAVTNPAVTARPAIWLDRFAWLTLGWNVLVVMWGALVRATGSGAGCGNHWPLCNGQVIPLSPGLHTIIEFTHRTMTGVSGWLVLGLVVAVWRYKPKSHPARRAAVAAGIFLLLEAVLGALLVKLGYVTGNRSIGRVLLLSVHLTNTLALLGTLALTAWLAADRPKPRIDWLGWTAIVSTAIVGVSGSLAALGDTLFPSTSLRAAFAQDLAADAPALLRLRGLHPLSVLAATAALLFVVRRAKGRSTLSSWVVSLFLLQIVLGIADLLLLAPWWMQVLHLLGADLYWISLLLLLFAIGAPPSGGTTSSGPGPA